MALVKIKGIETMFKRTIRIQISKFDMSEFRKRSNACMFVGMKNPDKILMIA